MVDSIGFALMAIALHVAIFTDSVPDVTKGPSTPPGPPSRSSLDWSTA